MRRSVRRNQCRRRVRYVRWVVSRSWTTCIDGSNMSIQHLAATRLWISPVYCCVTDGDIFVWPRKDYA